MHIGDFLHLRFTWGFIGYNDADCRENLFQATRLRSLILKIVGVGIAGYGIYAFIQRDFPEYMFLQTPFVFFDFDEPIFSFLLIILQLSDCL